MESDDNIDIRDPNSKEIAFLLRYRRLSDEDKAEFKRQMEELHDIDSGKGIHN